MIEGHGINVGKLVDVESIKATREGIMEILNARADQETIRMALECMHDAVKMPNNVSINNCAVVGDSDGAGNFNVTSEEDVQ